ncbi:MAG: type II toxin-antitoxin system VapC family toxin [Chloroflexi bacterium CFX1]|nr:type II toxin-antitoxin system VapC family toxin [Anaerolineales bacterium]MCE7921040.1 type II toxin-antitoxin system VapC family toxin [Chloroflexi bacterium CFX1]MCK6568580.1 type II toxin-antitoxin system VapC family toxin [Anaerolineales bacterium]MCQ3954766.1 VapC toxin family PIN domain ribonuclease [Chloroflexota bacterium]NUQ58946.1 type II toxin-antitoxin system VapC family toxin [Anaerolineales bacterium]
MKYMLDTNICIGLIRQKPQKLIGRLMQCEPGDVGVSSITIAELAHGAYKSNQVEQNLSALDQFLLPIEVVDFDQRASSTYGFVRAHLEKEGKIIGSMDLLIGAHALSLGVVLVTNNVIEFQRIPKLRIEDWMG